MGTQAGFTFATGMEYIKFDEVLAIIRTYKEGLEAEQEIHIPSPETKLFKPGVKVHTFDPYAKEIAKLKKAMELVERARELTIEAITQSDDEEPVPIDWPIP